MREKEENANFYLWEAFNYTLVLMHNCWFFDLGGGGFAQAFITKNKKKKKKKKEECDPSLK